MRNHVLDYLTEAARRAPERIAFSDGKEEMTFGEIYEQSRRVGTYLHNCGIYKEPVIIFMNRHPRTIAAFFGVIAGGNYYVPVDVEMPEVRIRLIMENVKASAVICDEDTLAVVRQYDFAGQYDAAGQIVSYDEVCRTEVNEEALADIYDRAIDTDPVYIVFTSGSTGIPKGVTACHRSVIDYVESFSEAMKFDEHTVFGNQAPLYMDACLKELYPTLKFCACTYLIPKELFMFPVKLVEFLNEHRINTICWVAPALTTISAFGTFDKIVPAYLKLIAFVSEIFPVKQLNKWKAVLPHARYINLYGPTEGTGVCCYYEVDREFEENEVIPIGRPFRNTDIILLKARDERAAEGESGEICIRGTSLTLGYYNNFDRTRESFVQNPLNPFYPELIYRTGDIGQYNERGELEFISRRDYQIKHMGHRIELGEIEINVNMMDEIKMAGCIYDDVKSRIVLYYVGAVTEKELAAGLKTKLPRYMIPNNIIRLEQMPLTMNGKIDRIALKKSYQKKG